MQLRTVSNSHNNRIRVKEYTHTCSVNDKSNIKYTHLLIHALEV